MSILQVRITMTKSELLSFGVLRHFENFLLIFILKPLQLLYLIHPSRNLSEEPENYLAPNVRYVADRATTGIQKFKADQFMFCSPVVHIARRSFFAGF